MKLGISGARFIAETLKGYGVSHVFLVMLILKKTLVELEDVGIRRIVTHSEKTAAYMADGYARISGKPVIVAGGGACDSSAGPQIVRLAETLSIPVATSNDGKGIITDTHPLCAGVVGTYSCRSANQVVSEADLVFYL